MDLCRGRTNVFQPIIQLTVSLFDGMHQLKQLRSKNVQLRQYLSSFLIQVHPDRFGQHSQDIRNVNEKGIQELNELLDFVEKRCNNEDMNAVPAKYLCKKPIQLEFYIAQDTSSSELSLLQCKLPTPTYIGQAQAPWRRYANQCVQQLLGTIQVEFDESNLVGKDDKRVIKISEMNRRVTQKYKRENSNRNDGAFYELLKKDYDVVVPITTGYENVPGKLVCVCGKTVN